MVEHKPTGPIDRVTFAFSRVMIWGSLFLVGIMFYEVVMRYVFFRPTLWVNEMSLWVGGIIYITAGLYAMQQRSHIRIYVLYEMAPKWMRKLFDVLSVVCTSIFVVAVVWGGFGEALAKFARWEAFGTAWDPPIPATDKPIVLVALFFLVLQALSNLVRDWPSAAWVRKAFDVLACATVTVLCLWALPMLFPSGETEFAVPTAWRFLFAALLLAAVAYSAVGLFRDFGVTPAPFVEHHDPTEEFDLPDDVMSGRPHDPAGAPAPADGEGHQGRAAP